MPLSSTGILKKANSDAAWFQDDYEESDSEEKEENIAKNAEE